jgi:hypothetical protein
LEEVAIMKSVQNWISYSHEFFPDFSLLPSYFSALESDFGIYLKSIFSMTCGARLSAARPPHAMPSLASLGGVLLAAHAPV